MRARRWVGFAVLVVASSAAAEPKPKAVDIKAFRDKLVVLQDSEGGTYVVQPTEDGRIFFGLPKKPLYEQVVVGRSADGSAGSWEIDAWAPKVLNIQPGSVMRKADGSFYRYCGEDSLTPLTQISTDKAKAILDKGPFMTSALVRRPYLLARDDSGVYYYVDVIRQQYGGNGYRVFIGKKGAMKQKPLTDIAKDTAGDVFATKTGDLRFVRDLNDSGKSTLTWVKGGKKETLVNLDVDANSVLIFKELGVYTFTGSMCDNI